MSYELSPRLFDAFTQRLLENRIMKGELLEELEIVELLKQTRGIWQFDYSRNNFELPHAIQRNRFHTDAYIWCSQLLRFPRICTLLATQLIRKIQGFDIAIDNIDWVIGSTYAGIAIAFEVANLLNAQHGFTQKTLDGQSLNSLDIGPNDRVLLVEDLVQTLKTTEEQKKSLITVSGLPVQFVPVIGVFFNASSKTHYGHEPIISLINRPITFWPADECPLCQKGSPALDGEKDRPELMKFCPEITI